MKTVILFVVLVCSLLTFAADPNYVNADGSLNVEVLMAMLNDPNRLAAIQDVNTVAVPEAAAAVTEEAKSFNIPFIGQWLTEGTKNIVEFPKAVKYSDTKGIQWHFTDGVWKPEYDATGNLAISGRGWADSAILDYTDKEGNIWHLEFTGQFRVNGYKQIPPSCDRTGDCKVNLEDFADWARTYKP